MPSRYRILAVDDDRELTAILSEQLRIKGFDVTTASGGAEAIAHVRGHHFDCVLLDLKMPAVSGYDVLSFLKKIFPKTRIIVLTGYANLKTIEKCRKLGANDVIGKPYDLENLFEIIETVVGSPQV